jgi:hypothetical protein
MYAVLGYVIWILIFAHYGSQWVTQGAAAFGWYSFACAVLLPAYPIRLSLRLEEGVPGNGWDRYANMAFGASLLFFMLPAIKDMAVITPAAVLKWLLPGLFYAGGLAGLFSVLACIAGARPAPEERPRRPYSQPEDVEEDVYDFDPGRFGMRERDEPDERERGRRDRP